MLPMNYPLSNHDRRRTKPKKYMIVVSLTELLDKNVSSQKNKSQQHNVSDFIQAI